MGESWNKALRPLKLGELMIRLSTVLGPVFEGLRSIVTWPDFEALRGVSSDDRGVFPAGVISGRSCVPPSFGPGDVSGDSEGKDSSVLVDEDVTRDEVDVTSDCLRDFNVRTVPDLREAVEV